MANHVHRQIRELMETALGGLTTSGTRVYANRLKPMADGNLPGLRIYLDEEQSVDLTVHGPVMQQRSLAAIVECCAKASATDLDDTLDLMSKEVEVALSGGLSLGGRIHPLAYAGMEFSDEQGEIPLGVKRLRFNLEFETLANSPDTFN